MSHDGGGLRKAVVVVKLLVGFDATKDLEKEAMKETKQTYLCPSSAYRAVHRAIVGMGSIWYMLGGREGG
jgi:hypothetical protein